jgi:hypothetical protein
MKLTKTIFLLVVLVIPILSSTVITFDEDETLYELLESMNEEEEEDDVKKTQHNCDFSDHHFDKNELFAGKNPLRNYYFKNRIFQSIQPEVLTPPPRRRS